MQQALTRLLNQLLSSTILHLPMFLYTGRVDVFVCVSMTTCSPALQYLRSCGSSPTCLLTRPALKTQDTRKKDSKDKLKVWNFTLRCSHLHCEKRRGPSDWLGRVVLRFVACCSPTVCLCVRAEHRTFFLEHFCCYMTVLLGRAPAGIYSFCFSCISFFLSLHN